MSKQSGGKRIFDIIFSLTALLCLLPLLPVIAVLIKISSKGPVFYTSLRVGLHGKQIGCLKFRTMVLDADRLLETTLRSDPKLKARWESEYKLQNDFRVTRIGKFLRKTSLDELPQFWNVLKGDLSVVGPRPVSFAEVPLFLQKDGGKIFLIRPGLTGLWQTSGRSNLSYEKRIELEKLYLEKRSFGFDLLLIVKTIPLMFFPKGAF